MNDSSPFIKIREIASQAMQNGDLSKTEPVVATSIILGGAIRLIQSRLDGLIEKPLAEFLDITMASLWDGLKSNS